MTLDAEAERRALALFERIADADPRRRERLLRGVPATILARVEALERSHRLAPAAMPTELPDAPVGAEVPPPETVGPFRLIAPIGAGGMGEVWRAVRDDGLFDQTVAVKLLRAHLAPLAAGRFVDERRMLARLEHPNIARLIDGGVTASGRPYLVTEHIDGRAIDEAAADRPLAARVTLFVKAADAVQFAHGRLVVHADLKPSNILVTGDGRVKLVDFGIARMLGEDSDGRIHPITRAYASPGRLTGAAPTIADDVHALGLILSELCGAEPDLAAIGAKAASPDEADGYGSVAALIADVDRWRERLPVSARAPTLRYRAGKFVARHRVGVAASALAATLLTGATTAAVVSAALAERARARAEARYQEVRGLANYQLFDLYDRLAVAPGTVGLRAGMAAESARYLDRLNALPEASPAILLETAAGYRRLAAVEGLSGTASLGRPDRARRALDRAEALGRRVLVIDPGNAAARDLIGWVYADRWTLLANNAESPRVNRVAAGWFDRALALDPALSHARLGRLVTRKSMAYDLITADRPGAAERVARSALAELGRTRLAAADRMAELQLRATLLNTLGDALYALDDIAGSAAVYRAQAVLVAGAAARDGWTPDWLTRRGEAMFDLSGSLGDLPGREADALAAADSGVAAVEAVLRSGPDANAEKKLVMLLGQQAAVLDAMGRHTAAVTASARSMVIRRARLAAAPADPARVRDVAIAATGHAGFLAAAGRRAEACGAARQSLAMWRRLAVRGELGVRDRERNLSKAATLGASYCGPDDR